MSNWAGLRQAQAPRVGVRGLWIRCAHRLYNLGCKNLMKTPAKKIISLDFFVFWHFFPLDFFKTNISFPKKS